MSVFSRPALLALLLAAAPSAWAQTATQDVTIIVEEIIEIAVSGNVTLTIDAATAGQDPDDATDNSTTYDLTTNGAGKKITGVLGADYASGISLSIALAAPAGGGTSEGTQALGTTGVDLVTGVANLAETGLGITYTASVTGDAAPNTGAGETQTVTFTVTDV